MGENFLQEDIIRERVAAATISARVGDWLSDPANARRVVDEVADVAAIALGKVRDEHIADLVTNAFVPRFREEPIAPLLGSLLSEMVRDDLHHGVVDLGLDELHRLAGAQPRHVRRGAQRAGALVGAAAAQRGASPSASTSRPCAGSRTSARPRPPRPRGPGLDARPARPRPARRRRHPGPRRALQGAAARPPAGRHHGDLAVEGDALGAADVGPRPRRRRPPAAARRAQRLRRAAAHRRLAARAAGPHRRRRRGLRGRRATARSSPRSSPTPSSAGTARRPPGASSCTWAATSSSSGSTAPSSAGSSAC